MSVYLGLYGYIALHRQSVQGVLKSVVNASDVNTSKKRFSFDFAEGQLLTGDQLEISSTNGSQLLFVDPTGWTSGTRYTAGKWYIHVDELGGVRLYSTFADAINGLLANAVTLTSIVTDIPIQVRVENTKARILGQVTEYELNTSREAVDVTALSEDFRSQYSTLISGSGSITCLWDYANVNDKELSQYLLQLILRTEIGSEFKAQFYIKADGYSEGGSVAQLNDRIWYDVTGILTGAAVQFAADRVVQMTANFVTTGPVRLRVATLSGEKVLQESLGELLLEQDAQASLLQEATD